MTTATGALIDSICCRQSVPISTDSAHLGCNACRETVRSARERATDGIQTGAFHHSSDSFVSPFSPVDKPVDDADSRRGYKPVGVCCSCKKPFEARRFSLIRAPEQRISVRCAPQTRPGSRGCDSSSDYSVNLHALFTDAEPKFRIVRTDAALQALPSPTPAPPPSCLRIVPDSDGYSADWPCFRNGNDSLNRPVSRPLARPVPSCANDSAEFRPPRRSFRICQWGLGN